MRRTSSPTTPSRSWTPQADADRPFCLDVHYTAPHAPWGRKHHSAELWDDYHGNCPFESVPGADEPRPLGYQAPRVDAERRRENLAGYFAAIEGMDRNVGRLLDWLEARDLRSNTLVVFVSDNGMNMGHHGLYGKGNATWPQNMFDTSVKVPCLVSRPGSRTGRARARRVAQPVRLAADAARLRRGGGPRSAGTAGAGRSPRFSTAGPSVRGESVYVFDEYGPVRMIRSREWKLVWRYPGGPHELYHVAEDPEERRNLFSRRGHRDRIRTLRRELDDWYSSYVDPDLDGTRLPVTGRGQRDLATAEDPFAYRLPWLE